jgi:Sec-independent protein translocase protein TatA
MGTLIVLLAWVVLGAVVAVLFGALAMTERMKDR